MKKMLACVVGVTLIGCATPQPPYQVYEGEKRPQAEVAEIRGSNNCNSENTVVGETRVIKIGDESASSFDLGYQRDLQVLPGPQKITVRWFFAALRSNHEELEFTAKAGHRYIVRAKSNYSDNVVFRVEDKGPGSALTPFQLPKNPDGSLINCY